MLISSFVCKSERKSMNTIFEKRVKLIRGMIVSYDAMVDDKVFKKEPK